jgi:hypothetical protein
LSALVRLVGPLWCVECWLIHCCPGSQVSLLVHFLQNIWIEFGIYSSLKVKYIVFSQLFVYLLISHTL